MRMVKEFVIATDVSEKSLLELQLYNLKLRLRLQEKMVEKTKSDIAIIEDLLGN